jgi:hypothetical protein
VKLNSKTKKLFIDKLKIFIEDERDPSLRTHKLKGKRKNEYSLYEKQIKKEEELLIFKFIDIGGHNRVY